MNLIDFIDTLKDNKKLTQYMENFYPDIDYYDAEVYLKDTLSIDSELVIFDGDKIEGMIEMEIDKTKYYNLFSLDLLVETFEDYFDLSKTNIDIANDIMSYRINDA